MKTQLFYLLALLLVVNTSRAQIDTDIVNDIYLLDESGAQQALGIWNHSNYAGALLSVMEESTYFNFVKTDDGYYYIINADNGLYLEPQSNPVVNGSRVIQNAPKGNDRQKWQIILGRKYYYNDYSEQSYYILPKVNDNLYISIKGAQVVLSEKYQTFGITSCFSGSSLVQIKPNEYIPIHDVVKGMEVLCYNDNTKQTEFAVVDSLLVHDAGSYSLTRLSFVKSDVLLASVNPGFYIQNVDATPNHPILTPEGYKPIGDIKHNDIIYFYSEQGAELMECVVLDVKSDVCTEEKVYNLKLENGNSYIINSVVASPKCPFVSVIDGDNVYEISEILRNQLSSNLNMYDKVHIPASMIKDNVLKIRIDERKEEITYLQAFYLEVGQIILRTRQVTGNSIFEDESNLYDGFILQQGDYIEIEFLIPEGTDKESIYLIAKGFYEIL